MSGPSEIQSWDASWLGRRVVVDDREDRPGTSDFSQWSVRGELVGVNHHVRDGAIITTVTLAIAGGQEVTVDVVLSESVPTVH